MRQMLLAVGMVLASAVPALADYDFRRGAECPEAAGVVFTGPVTQIFTDKMEAEVMDVDTGKRVRFPAIVTAGEGAAEAPIMQLVQVAYATGLWLKVVVTPEGHKWATMGFRQRYTDHTYCWGDMGTMPVVPVRKHPE